MLQAACSAQPKNLDIYWIDVEGGAATLIVSPSGESLLIDTGYAVGDRDAKRIYAAAQQAGLKKIDHLVISHFHGDHAGGLAALSKMIPIGRFYGHGDAIETENQQWLDSYQDRRGRQAHDREGRRRDSDQGLRSLVVASDRDVWPSPSTAAARQSALRRRRAESPGRAENQRMVGVLLTYSKFKFLNLIDLDWEKEMELACPVNKFGTVTLYQTSRHGSLDGAGSPAFLGAIKPQVVVVNNGPRKGMGQIDTAQADHAPGQAVDAL